MDYCEDIEQHALECFPEECVGYVLENQYHRLENTSKRPTENYRLSPKDKLMLYSLGKRLTALVHSHPAMDNNPSDTDLKAFKASGFNFFIVGTDGQQTTDIREMYHETTNPTEGDISR